VLLDLCAGRDDWRNDIQRASSHEGLPQLPSQRRRKRATGKEDRLSSGHRL